eukprot:RCo016446
MTEAKLGLLFSELSSDSLVFGLLLLCLALFMLGGPAVLIDGLPGLARLRELWSVWWFMGAFCVYRAAARSHLYVPLARWLGVRGLAEARKFSTQCMGLQIHLSSAVFLYFYIRNKPWYRDIDRILEGCPLEPVEPMEPAVLLFFMAHMGYNASSLVFCLTERGRRDFWQLVVHHATALALLGMGYFSGFLRHGCLVLFVSDASDWLVCLAKMVNYTGHRPATFTAWACLVTCWLYTRCYLLPFWVLRNMLSRATLTYMTRGGPLGVAVLVVVNYYWAFLMIRMLGKYLSKDTMVDLSETPSITRSSNVSPREDEIPSDLRHCHRM